MNAQRTTTFLQDALHTRRAVQFDLAPRVSFQFLLSYALLCRASPLFSYFSIYTYPSLVQLLDTSTDGINVVGVNDGWGMVTHNRVKVNNGFHLQLFSSPPRAVGERERRKVRRPKQMRVCNCGEMQIRRRGFCQSKKKEYLGGLKATGVHSNPPYNDERKGRHSRPAVQVRPSQLGVGYSVCDRDIGSYSGTHTRSITRQANQFCSAGLLPRIWLISFLSTGFYERTERAIEQCKCWFGEWRSCWLLCLG